MMFSNKARAIFVVYVLAVTIGVSNQVATGDTFGAYWYQGKAEITRYELTQAR